MVSFATQKAFNAFPIGRVLAERYEVLAHLGHGSMGIVLKAKDLLPDAEHPVVALKILYEAHARKITTLKRFHQEPALAKKLSHPNIVKVIEFGSDGDGTQFFTMEFIEGESLDAKLKRSPGGRLPFAEVISIVMQVSRVVWRAPTSRALCTAI